MLKTKNGDWPKRRKCRPSIPIGKAVLMIYCGKRTEPQYFGDALRNIKINKEIESMGITQFVYKEEILPVDPKGMAEKVLSFVKSHDLSFDEVYVVFDKDDFKDDNFDNAVAMIDNLNGIAKYPDTTFIALWSNQCIELWFVLHFEYLQSKLEREDYFNKLKGLLNLKHKYKKNIGNIYEMVSGSKERLSTAINNASKLLDRCKNESSYSDKFPATNVVEFFKKYKNSL